MSIRYISYIVLLSFLSGSPAFSNPDLRLEARNGFHKFDFFDTQTPVWTYNGGIPGPVIRSKEGSLLVIDVVNKLKEPTSVHWHGLRIDNAMDGVPGVTQDPIKPGETFRYKLDLKEPGTYWYHPHFNSGEQLERGMKGVLVIEEKDPKPWSQDIVWLLDDWRFQNDGKIYPHFNIHPDLMHDGRWGNAVTVNGRVKPEISTLPGQRIRLRLINGANARIFAHTMEGLSPVVIAVDGRPVSSFFEYKNFYLSPGNRVDLDITIPKDAAGKTYLLEDTFTRTKMVLAKIVVKNAAPVPTPSFDPDTASDFIPETLFETVSVSKQWDLDLIRGGKFGIGWSLNQRLWPDADKAEFEIGKPVKIQFTNNSTRLHPMHLHGVFFRVLAANGNMKVEPFTRDTVLVGPRQTIVVGFVPEHDGIWLTHCHIQAHAESGMMTTIKVE